MSTNSRWTTVRTLWSARRCLTTRLVIRYRNFCRCGCPDQGWTLHLEYLVQISNSSLPLNQLAIRLVPSLNRYSCIFRVSASVNLSYKGFGVSFSATSVSWDSCGHAFLGHGVSLAYDYAMAGQDRRGTQHFLCLIADLCFHATILILHSIRCYQACHSMQSHLC